MVQVVRTTYAHHFHTNRTKSYKTWSIQGYHLQHFGAPPPPPPHTHTHAHGQTLSLSLCTYFHPQSRAHQFTDCAKLVAMEVNGHQQQHLTKWCSNTTCTTNRIHKKKLQYMGHNWQQIKILCRNLQISE